MIYLRSVYVSVREGQIAHHLTALEEEFGVMIGSYPRTHEETDYRVHITIESRDAQRVNDSVEHLLTLIDKNAIVRMDPPVPDGEHISAEVDKPSPLSSRSTST